MGSWQLHAARQMSRRRRLSALACSIGRELIASWTRGRRHRSSLYARARVHACRQHMYRYRFRVGVDRDQDPGLTMTAHNQLGHFTVVWSVNLFNTTWWFGHRGGQLSGPASKDFPTISMRPTVKPRPRSGAGAPSPLLTSHTPAAPGRGYSLAAAASPELGLRWLRVRVRACGSQRHVPAAVSWRRAW